MKKLLLASAIAALSVTAANAAPTVYGKAFLILDYQDIDDESNTQLNSKSSRIGFKGSEALTANTDVIYKLEYQVDVDGDDDVFKQRDTYLGLANDQYGTVMAGRLTTIDDLVDFGDVLEGKNVAQKAGLAYDEDRANNAFAYVSPDYDGFQVLAMYGIDSDQDSGSLDDEDQYGIGATYTTGPINLGASYIAHGENAYARISGNYAVTPELTLGVLYQNSDLDKDENENGVMLSAELATATPWTVYGQVNMIDNVEGEDGDEKLGVGVGGKYKFTKAATGHLYAGYYDEEIAKADKDGYGVGAGLEYKF